MAEEHIECWTSRMQARDFLAQAPRCRATAEGQSAAANGLLGRTPVVIAAGGSPAGGATATGAMVQFSAYSLHLSHAPDCEGAGAGRLISACILDHQAVRGPLSRSKRHTRQAC